MVCIYKKKLIYAKYILHINRYIAYIDAVPLAMK